MKERPIIFTGESVRAILAGKKTQTRRLITPQPTTYGGPTGPMVGHKKLGGQFAERLFGRCMAQIVSSPYGGAGDHLWVKESWKSSEYTCDEDHQPEDHHCSKHCKQTYVYYAATPRVGYRPVPDRERIVYLDESSPLTEWYTKEWRTPLFMPRWASRLSLEVAEVRVERLQAIAEADAIAEGMAPYVLGNWSPEQALTSGERIIDSPYRAAYAVAWDEINDRRATWKSNLWVWVLSFKVAS